MHQCISLDVKYIDIIRFVVLKSTSHAVYEAKYHLVWCPKYRKKILVGEIAVRVKELFYQIAEQSR